MYVEDVIIEETTLNPQSTHPIIDRLPIYHTIPDPTKRSDIQFHVLSVQSVSFSWSRSVPVVSVSYSFLIIRNCCVSGLQPGWGCEYLDHQISLSGNPFWCMIC
uniref:(northern house mosquito) hypothetical protein n=1 Tax=Culex pipiens TaxID=7175 RepID=A0A8D8JIL1_CULPI